MKSIPLILALGWSLSLSGQPVRPQGTVVGWGENMGGEATGVPWHGIFVVPLVVTNRVIATGVVMIAGQQLNDATAIAASDSHALALRANATVVGWGGNLEGAAVGYETPSPQVTNGPVILRDGLLSNVVSVAAGRRFSLALKNDGTVVGWGDNRFGQTSVPAGLSDVTAIAAGAYQGLALKRDGSIAHWGQGAAPPKWLTNAVAIAAGGEYGQNLALRTDGTVVEWPVSSSRYTSTVPSGLSNVVGIATAGGARLALKQDGTVVGWGANRWGQATGIPTPEFPNQSTGTVAIAGQVLTNVAVIAASFDYSAALKKDGTILTWGAPPGMPVAPPVGLSNVLAIAPGGGLGFCLAITTNAAPLGEVSAQHEGRAADQPLSLSMSIPPSESGEYHLDPSRVPHFHVILCNCSNKPAKVWAPWSEASNRALTFEFTDESGNKSQAGWEDQGGISHKLPGICSLRPGESLVLDVPYSRGSGWKGWPKIADHLPTVKRQAAYQTSSGAQARGVWVGRLVSEPLTVTFYPE